MENQNHQAPETRTTPAPVSSTLSRNTLGIPIAIVIAATLIAGAIVFTGMEGKGTTPQVANVAGKNNQVTGEVAPVTEKDHIRGNPNASIVIVEYSDYDCPFCKNFHETMNKVMAEYGADGKVAWVFRHFPLESLHPNAPKTAAAAECVASLGGNEAFWKFSDLIYADRSTNEPTKVTKLPEYAEQSGVNKDTYIKCVQEGRFDTAIAESIEEAMATGARGTPYSILIAGDQRGPINGAQPYAVVKQMIDTLLGQMGAEVN